jgi:hypothetical protein
MAEIAGARASIDHSPPANVMGSSDAGRCARSVMTRNAPLPAVPDEVTPAWLTTVLRGAGVLRTAAVTAVDWEVIGEEQGFTGVVARLCARYSGGDPGATVPTTFVAKFPTASRTWLPAYRAAQERNTASARWRYQRCAREVSFYREIAPHGPALAPRNYFGAADDPSGRVVLLLEDVGGARTGDVLAGCSPVEAARVLDAMAPFHAYWWERADAPAWLPEWSGDHHTRQQTYAQRVEPFLDRFGASLPPPVRAAVEALRHGYARVLSALDRAPATVIHADLHLDNVLFVPADAERPVVVLDWQSVAKGAAAVDLAFFLVGSLAPDDRRMAEEGLLRRYYECLVEHGMTGYPLARLRDDYRLALLRFLAGIVGWLAGVDFDRLTGRERSLAEAAVGDGRLVAALLDHDAAALVGASA